MGGGRRRCHAVEENDDARDGAGEGDKDSEAGVMPTSSC